MSRHRENQDWCLSNGYRLAAGASRSLLRVCIAANGRPHAICASVSKQLTKASVEKDCPLFEG